MPLVDSEGNVFGVIGMGITEDYLYSKLPTSEMVNSNITGYSLAIYDRENKHLEPVLNYEDIVENEIVPLGSSMEINVYDKELNLYNVNNTSAEFPVLSSLHYLNLYKDSPYEHKEWVFIGYANQDILLSSSTEFVATLLIAFLVVIILGLFMAVFFAKK